ncbi:MAG: prepilin-type N-terminal cleavage/methylation domain-containing protein [Gemmatimonadaceae bacterium]
MPEQRGQPANPFKGSTMRNKGFTLIELLIVIVIIGILAAIAIPKFANTKEKAYVASMKADLRNLATYEESFSADSAVYFSGTATGATALQGFLASQNVTVTATAVAGPPASWTAQATQSQTTKTCSSSVTGVISCT